MAPLILSASCRLLRSAPLVPLFSVLISVAHADGSFVSHLSKQAFDFGYFPSGDPSFGANLKALVTTEFQNFSNVPDQVAPGLYGLNLAFPGQPTPYIPILFVTVTESVWIPIGPEPDERFKPLFFAQGQIVIGKIEDGDDFD